VSTASRYLSRMFLMRFFAILFGFAAFALGFELLEESEHILQSSDNDAIALARYSLLRLPSIFS
jgi:lipopolysaccharide export LptBFGC system permease protein LptF